MKRSRRVISIDMIVDWLLIKKKQITLLSCFTFIPKTGMGLLKRGVVFYCACLNQASCAFDSSIRYLIYAYG